MGIYVPNRVNKRSQYLQTNKGFNLFPSIACRDVDNHNCVRNINNRLTQPKYLQNTNQGISKFPFREGTVLQALQALHAEMRSSWN